MSAALMDDTDLDEERRAQAERIDGYDREYDAFIAKVSRAIMHPHWCLARGTRDTDSAFADDDGELQVHHSRDIDDGGPDGVGIYIVQTDVYGPGLEFLRREPAEVVVCEYDNETLTPAAAERLADAKATAELYIKLDQGIGGRKSDCVALYRAACADGR